MLLTHENHSFPSLSNVCHSGKKEEYVFTDVTLRFLSTNLLITSITSLLYLLHVSAVWFYVWLKLSIKDNQSNSIYKSCALFFLTNTTNFCTGSKVQLLTLLYTIFSRERNPFRIPFIDKWYRFHIPCLELCISFDSCKCTINSMGINNKNLTFHDFVKP